MTAKAEQVAARTLIVDELRQELGLDADAVRLLITGRRAPNTVPGRDEALVRARLRQARRDIVERTVREPIDPGTRPRGRA